MHTRTHSCTVVYDRGEEDKSLVAHTQKHSCWFVRRWESLIDPSVVGRLMCCRGIETDRERVCGRGEERREVLGNNSSSERCTQCAGGYL